MPVGERPNPVAEQTDYLLSLGIGIDVVDWEAADDGQTEPQYVRVWTPLSVAVRNRDYEMARFLLERGADPAVKLLAGLDGYGGCTFETWMLRDLDAAIRGGDEGEALRNDVEIAALLLGRLPDGWKGGERLEVDPVARIVRCGSVVGEY